MTGKSKLFLIFGIMFAAMFVFIIVSGVVTFFILPMMSGKHTVELNQKRSAETQGTITFYSTSRSSGSARNSKYGFQYVGGGVTYNSEQSWGKGGEESKGTKVKVCFDPADPKSSAFYSLEDNKTCGK